MVLLLSFHVLGICARMSGLCLSQMYGPSILADYLAGFCVLSSQRTLPEPGWIGSPSFYFIFLPWSASFLMYFFQLVLGGSLSKHRLPNLFFFLAYSCILSFCRLVSMFNWLQSVHGHFNSKYLPLLWQKRLFENKANIWFKAKVANGHESETSFISPTQ